MDIDKPYPYDTSKSSMCSPLNQVSHTGRHTQKHINLRDDFRASNDNLLVRSEGG